MIKVLFTYKPSTSVYLYLNTEGWFINCPLTYPQLQYLITMTHKLLDALFVICVLVSFAVSRLWLKRRNQKYPLPPRPKGLPVIGNLLDMLSTREIHALEGLRSDYGKLSEETAVF